MKIGNYNFATNPTKTCKGTLFRTVNIAPSVRKKQQSCSDLCKDDLKCDYMSLERNKCLMYSNANCGNKSITTNTSNTRTGGDVPLVGDI